MKRVGLAKCEELIEEILSEQKERGKFWRVATLNRLVKRRNSARRAADRKKAKRDKLKEAKAVLGDEEARVVRVQKMADRLVLKTWAERGKLNRRVIVQDRDKVRCFTLINEEQLILAQKVASYGSPEARQLASERACKILAVPQRMRTSLEKRELKVISTRLAVDKMT